MGYVALPSPYVRMATQRSLQTWLQAAPPPNTLAIRLATFAIVPVNRFCIAVSPLSKGDPQLCA